MVAGITGIAGVVVAAGVGGTAGVVGTAGIVGEAGGEVDAGRLPPVGLETGLSTVEPESYGGTGDGSSRGDSSRIGAEGRNDQR